VEEKGLALKPCPLTTALPFHKNKKLGRNFLVYGEGMLPSPVGTRRISTMYKKLVFFVILRGYPFGTHHLSQLKIRKIILMIFMPGKVLGQEHSQNKLPPSLGGNLFWECPCLGVSTYM
jgi:hypothetical protein